MNWIDTHTHLYSDNFEKDREAMIHRALAAGVTTLLLPNIDETTLEDMLALEAQFPENCFPMMGLHPV
ncbi:MAG TPA: TatD family hydrolase, partial [Chitinophaga sp.]